LREDYVKTFDACLQTLSTDFAFFAHPDMVLDDPGNIGFLGDAHAYYCNMRSFGGEPDGPLFEIVGRGEKWKNIMRLRKPNLGLHYWGFYGHRDEDMYFSKITGNTHLRALDGNVIEHLDWYPYAVKDSGIKILHYSDVRPYERRFSRMVKCHLNNNFTQAEAEDIAAKHPRVIFKDG